jgi:hypothetical protein
MKRKTENAEIEADGIEGLGQEKQETRRKSYPTKKGVTTGLHSASWKLPRKNAAYFSLRSEYLEGLKRSRGRASI